MREDIISYLEPLQHILEKTRMVAGISNQFSDITRLREYNYQAFKSLQLGSMIHREATLNYYRDYMLYHMVEIGIERGGMTHFCMPEMHILLDYCRENGTELLHTLQAYLNCKCNKAQTAKVLFTHPNTVKYRINQIEEIMGIGLNDQDTVVQLTLSLKMLEYSRCFPSGSN